MPHQVRHDMLTKSKEASDALHYPGVGVMYFYLLRLYERRCRLTYREKVGSMDPYTEGSGIGQRGLFGRIAGIHDFHQGTSLNVNRLSKTEAMYNR